MRPSALLTIFLLLFSVQTINASEEKNSCVLTKEEIEQENAFSWNPRSIHAYYTKDPDGTYFIYHRRRSYEKDNIAMSIYTYFGKFGFKAWACNENRDPLTGGDTPSHGIAILLNDGTWHHRVPAQKPDTRVRVYNKSGKLIGIIITFDNKEVFIQR